MANAEYPLKQRDIARPFARWDYALLALVSLGLLIPGIGSIPFRRAEIYFADAARAMVESGDWLIPHFQGVPFFDKPVLSYWFMAASFSQFGFSTAAARMTSVLATLAVILLTLWLGRMLWADHSGLIAGLMLAATPSFMDFGRLAMSDALLTLWSTLTVALAVFLHRTERTFWPAVALGLTLGLGFLTKGPIAWITPGLGVVCAIGVRRDRRPRISAAALSIGVALLLGVAFGWFAAVYLRSGWAPLSHFFFKENLARFSGGSYDVGNPIWFFPQTYLHEGAPWSVFLPLAAAYFLWRAPDRECRWLLSWILLDSMLLSVSRGKLGYYLLPLYPAASLVIARYFSVARWGRTARGFASALLVAVALILALVPAAIVRAPAGWRPAGATLLAVIGAIIAAALACVVAAFRVRPLHVFTVLAGASMIVFVVAESVLLPAFYQAQPNDAIAEVVREERGRRPALKAAAREDTVALSRELLFDARLPLQSGADLPLLAASGQPYLLIANSSDRLTLQSMRGVRKIAEYPYISPRIFSVHGFLHGMTPDRLFLFANYPE